MCQWLCNIYLVEVESLLFDFSDGIAWDSRVISL